jgi:hypothetical protein
MSSGLPEVAALVAAITLDPREFSSGRWWTRRQLESAGPALFDPEMGRFLAKVRGQPRA